MSQNNQVPHLLRPYNIIGNKMNDNKALLDKLLIHQTKMIGRFLKALDNDPDGSDYWNGKIVAIKEAREKLLRYRKPNGYVPNSKEDQAPKTKYYHPREVNYDYPVSDYIPNQER